MFLTFYTLKTVYSIKENNNSDKYTIETDPQIGTRPTKTSVSIVDKISNIFF